METKEKTEIVQVKKNEEEMEIDLFKNKPGQRILTVTVEGKRRTATRGATRARW